MDIRCFIMDVDGVLTNGALVYSSNGEELKSFNVKDGMGLSAARMQGIKIGIITARVSPMVERRAKELKFDFLHMGSHNKSQALREICQAEGLELSQVAYMGDDLNDLGPLHLAGLAFAPSNACEEAKKAADFITPHEGGAGAVRDAVEYILKEMGLWAAVVDAYEKETYQVKQ